MEENKVDYYNVGTRDDIVISNSSLSWINPLEGGSPQKFLSFFDRDTETKKPKYFERGDLLHEYMKDKSAFIVAELEKPTEMMAKFIENLYQIWNTIGIDLTIEDRIYSNLKKEDTRNAHILKIQEEFNQLAVLLDVPQEEIIRLVRQARGILYKSYTNEDSFIQLVKQEGIEYYKFLEKADGKTALTKSDKFALDSAIKSIENNQAIVNLLITPFGEEVLDLKELEVYFIYNGLKAKAKLDRLIINKTQKKIRYIDYKGTSKSIYLFKESFEKYNYDQQHSFYGGAIRNYCRQNNIDTEGYTIEFYNMVVELTGFFISTLYLVHDAYLVKGFNKVKDLVNRIKWHIDNNIWDKSWEEHLHNGILTLIPDDCT